MLKPDKACLPFYSPRMSPRLHRASTNLFELARGGARIWYDSSVPTFATLEMRKAMAAKFEIKKAKNGQYFFNLKAGNGQVILTSEQYKAKDSAQNGIKSVKKHAKAEKHFDRRESKKGEPYFVLMAANNEIIGTSEMYKGKSGRDNGIKSVMTNAPGARVDDLSEK